MKKRFRCKAGKGVATFYLARPDPMVLYATAYVLSQSAYVVLGKTPKAMTITLRPKPGTALSDLIASFENELFNQDRRWRTARLTRRSKADEANRVLEFGRRLQDNAQTVSPLLDGAAILEIERLLKESQDLPWDPLRVAKPWMELRR